jgi:hypothetical protein
MKCVARTIPYDIRSKNIADWESSSSLKRSMAFWTREKSFPSTKEAENEAEPKGTPKIQISEVGTKVTPSMGQGSVLLSLSQDHSHFEGFRCRPRAGPFSFNKAQTFSRTGTDATIPPSSMYHFWYSGFKLEIS